MRLIWVFLIVMMGWSHCTHAYEKAIIIKRGRHHTFGIDYHASFPQLAWTDRYMSGLFLYYNRGSVPSDSAILNASGPVTLNIYGGGLRAVIPFFGIVGLGYAQVSTKYMSDKNKKITARFHGVLAECRYQGGIGRIIFGTSLGYIIGKPIPNMPHDIFFELDRETFPKVTIMGIPMVDAFVGIRF